MSHGYSETRNECDGCGATAEDRQRNKPTEPQGLTRCPHCNSYKCCMCDMGDDVLCGNCPAEEDYQLGDWFGDDE